MKLGIVTAFHGREALTALWCEHTAAFGLPIYAAITEGQSILPGVLEAVFMPNHPVGAKFTHAVRIAMEDGCDAVMILPSDDFVSAEWVSSCLGRLERGSVYLKSDRIAVHQPGRGSYMLKSDGRSCGSYGAGRVIHRRVIEAVGDLWPGGRSQGLDSESHGRILAAGFACEVVTTKAIPLVDIKCGENIHSWDSFRGSGHRCSDAEALHMLSPSVLSALSTPIPG